jgi:dTDP-4-dehydrorhamnose reductase
MKRLLVTGAAGFLGWHVCRLAAVSWETFGILKKPGPPAPGCEAVALDLIDTDRLTALFFDLAPDAVVHTAAVTDPNACEAHPPGTEPINVGVSRLLATCCARNNIPFVFTSTDLVFDGTSAPYAETAPPSPVNVYGSQKARAEAAVQKAWPGALICRLPLLLGWSGSHHQAFDRAIRRALKTKRRLLLFTDEFRTPADAASVAAGILRMLGRTSGILHLGGRERISRFEMGRRMAAVLKMNPDCLAPVRQRDIPMAARRPPDVSLVSDRACALGYDPLSFDDAIREAALRERDRQ